MGFFNALFSAVSARTCGLNSINIAQLSQGSTFFMCVMMYLATTPTVVTMRLSQITAGNPGELDITGRAEGIEEDVIKGDNSLKTQARRYLTQDITYLVVIMFVILVLEKPSFERSARRASPFSDGIYGDFNFFKVFFEMTSAYGTVGYSLGFQNQSASFSGVWCSASQYLLVGVMSWAGFVACQTLSTLLFEQQCSTARENTMPLSRAREGVTAAAFGRARLRHW